MEHALNLSGLLRELRVQPEYQELLEDITQQIQPHSRFATLGLIRAARPYVLAALAKDTARPIVMLSARLDHATNTAEQLLAWQPDLRVLMYSEPNPLFFEHAPWGPRSTRARLSVLTTLARMEQHPVTDQGLVIVSSARALMQRTLPRDELLGRSIVLNTRERIPGGQPDTLIRRWLDIGYEPSSIVTEPGTYSRRGGILDIYPIADAWPVRIELWGDEIESLRRFDPASQRRLDDATSVSITPAREALPIFGPPAAEALAGWFEANPPEETADILTSSDQRRLEDAVAFPAAEFYLPWMFPDTVSLLDYLPQNALLFVDDAEDLADTVADLESQALTLREAHEGARDIPPTMPEPYVTWAEINDSLSQLGAIELGGSQAENGGIGQLFGPGPRFGGQIRQVLEHIRTETRGQHDRVVLVSQQAARLAALWYEQGGQRLHTVEAIDTPPEPGEIKLVQGTLQQGWLLNGQDATTHLFTDAEIFGWKRPEPRRRPMHRAIAPESFFADLEPGDVVVHAEYGIGRFEGLEKRQLSGTEREFLLLSYAGGDTLYVPIHQADRLTRYVGSDDGEPQLSRLGTPDWNRVKTKTREEVEQKAEELLALYATRETVVGHAFSADTPWQQELEASFPYVETPDQLRALIDVKQDMESPQPMDRLIAGDVGYGKTEVALRAAFKAVMDGKQVAMLVPTTVLAQQHLETFTRRLAAFPIRVDMLSRFRTKTEQDQILGNLELGQIDIVVGTHRLLGKDVLFKDLGLLVIDEEQRFGVTHKERLKQMRTEVDVLTLTATPIPRTLYMSMTGVRDISTIETPPEERLPVITHVGRRDDNLIRQAILREIDREGQVFYVHNRVQTIHAETQHLQQLIPEARIGIGHGQMPEHELEAVMSQFAEGEIDILASTSIIEAGLDIPNANTLIVDRADIFGLSQLYQLRGRVGRGSARAYAYFFHPPLNRLTDDARARLETIAEQTQLGAGLSIAMRDLEIRGAGEILGTRQHGAMAAVGFHLYTRMLAQAVQRLKAQRSMIRGEDVIQEEAAPPREIVTIDLPIPTYIPTDYISDMSLRIQLYRRLADVNTASDIHELRSEMADRFGLLPPPVENLIFQLDVKRLALQADVEAVTTDGDQIAVRIPGLAHLDRPDLQRRLGLNVRVSRTAIWLPRGAEDDETWRETLLTLLERLAQELPLRRTVTDQH
jgi:transcription-repair coupling factor (superfamily II helicase)